MTPGRKFCTKTSEFLAKRKSSALPSGLVASMQAERLPGLPMIASEVMPSRPPPAARIQSPPGGSTLITFAPCMPSNPAQ